MIVLCVNVINAEQLSLKVLLLIIIKLFASSFWSDPDAAEKYSQINMAACFNSALILNPLILNLSFIDIHVLDITVLD